MAYSCIISRDALGQCSETFLCIRLTWWVEAGCCALCPGPRHFNSAQGLLVLLAGAPRFENPLGAHRKAF